VGATLQRPPDAGALAPSAGGLSPCPDDGTPAAAAPATLGALPVGARLILRCRKDWRAAAVCALAADLVVLSVASPSGHTYRVRRHPDSPLALDGPLPVLGEGTWRACFARYDLRW
jgi:hypothetical protein